MAFLVIAQGLGGGYQKYCSVVLLLYDGDSFSDLVNKNRSLLYKKKKKKAQRNKMLCTESVCNF